MGRNLVFSLVKKLGFKPDFFRENRLGRDHITINKVINFVISGYTKIKKEFEYKNVCVCAGSDTSKILELDGISIKRGQVTHIESLDRVSKIKLPICAKGYISPQINNIHLVGSSYSDSEVTDLSEEEHIYNLNNLKFFSQKENSLFIY